MKKILLLLLFLLLLIIVCVWTKKDNIHLNSHTQAPAVMTPAVAQKKQYIDYVIAQTNAGYTLNGNFTNTQQENLLVNTFTKAGKKLRIVNTKTKKSLQGDDAIAFTNKILPNFIQNYRNGKIVYHDEKMVITGTAKNYEAQREMQRLLNTSTIASQDNSNVVPQSKPITYKISKTGDKLHFEGVFNDNKQVQRIKSHLPQNATHDFKIKKHHVDTGSLRIAEKIVPVFVQSYTNGAIDYNGKELTVSGTVASESDLSNMKQLLQGSNIPVINRTKIDPQLLAKAQEEAAKRATLEAQRKAKEEAMKKAKLEAKAKAAKEAKAAALAALEAQRKAKEEAMKKAKLEAEAKAAKEAKAAALAALEAQRKAKEEAIKKAKLEAEAKAAEMKAKIAKLFELENIEFNVNKSTLTSKGQNTVNKLARILKEYTSVNIEIGGHTDSDGSAEYNQKLSQSRVDMVKSKLIAQSISSQRLTAKGYGEVKPLVPNTTRANKAKNRRVEITILGE